MYQPPPNNATGVYFPRRHKQKVCMVCGDKALSCNFGAITCESCKAFFRRHATKNIGGQCDGMCPVTVSTRAYCRKCRLLKCYSVGMRTELILTDNQKKERRDKIKENKIRRQSGTGEDYACSSSGQGGPSDSSTDAEYQMETSITGIKLEDHSPTQDYPAHSSGARVGHVDHHSSSVSAGSQESAPDSTYSPAAWGGHHPPPRPPSLAEDAQPPQTITSPMAAPPPGYASPDGPEVTPPGLSYTQGSSDSDTNTSVPAKNDDKPAPLFRSKGNEYVVPQVSDTLRSQLDPSMNALLDELIRAYDFGFNKPAKIAAPMMQYTEMFNLGEISIRRVIQMAKRVQLFNRLDREDQILLLKNSVIRVLVIRSSKSFDPATMGWKIPIQPSAETGNPPVHMVSSDAVRMHNPKFQQFFRQYAVWVTSLSRLTKNDDAIIMLIVTVCLFTYQGNKRVRAIDEIEKSRKIYSVLLARVIEDKRNDLVEAYDINRSIEAMISEMEPMNDIQDLILQSNVNELEPLIMEIFDIPAGTGDERDEEEKTPDES